MTRTSPSGLTQQAETRTLREVVVRSPALVNEVWCRKVFRQLLQSLEQRHALRQPHFAITPDTVGFGQDGEPVLLPSPDATGEPNQAADVQALGAVVHYAITGEMPPAAPLRGRALAGYSESLVGAVDKCTADDPRERPQTIAELRNLLGIVSLGPPVTFAPSAVADAFSETPAGHGGSVALLGRWQRWLLIGLAALVLLAAALALFALLRGTDARDNVVLALPQAEPPAKSLDPNETLMAAPQAPGTAAAGTGHAAAPAQVPPPMVTLPPTQSASGTRAAAANAPRPASTTYKLMIKPWGTVHVDGAESGVSPPLKRLTLPAGQHTIRIVNPNYRDRVIKVDAGKSASARITHDFAAPSR
jgi:hypothetical protein